MIGLIGLVVNPEKPEAFLLAAELVKCAAAAGKPVLAEGPAPESLGCPQAPLDEVAQRAGVIFVLGGDGSLLRVARAGAPRGTLIVGVQFGRYGFIMETEQEEACAALTNVLEGRFTVSNRLMLKAKLIRDGRCVGEYLALNDVVVSRGQLSRLLHQRVVVRAREVVRYAGDGIVIATPTGSTAYSLSAGGPVVHPDVDVIILTPIAPHTLNSRALVIPASEPIEVESVGAPAQAVLTVDGQLLEHLQGGDMVQVERAPFCAKLVQTRPSAFYEHLESRLGFGERFDR